MMLATGSIKMNSVTCCWRFDLCYMIEVVLGASVIALETKLVSVFVSEFPHLKEKVRKNVKRLTFLIRQSTTSNRNEKSYSEQ